MTSGVYVLSCRLTFGPLWLRIFLLLLWFLSVLFGLFLLYWTFELPCQVKLPEFHDIPILGCIRVLYLVFHPLGLGLDKVLFDWNSVSQYHKRTHKFGFEIPKMMRRALKINKECGNTLWQDAIANEMANVKVAFKVLPDGVKEPIGHQYMDCHLIYEIKLDSFRRKAQLVAGGRMTKAPVVMMYASVVSRETARIALTITALKDLEVKASDIQNAYLTAPCAEQICTRLGPKFGPDKGSLAVIVRALYGRKSAGASFGRHISDFMRTMGFEPCKADPDLWFRPAP